MFKKIKYNKLNSRQKENYNFQKVSALLAEYGFNSMWLNDDWQGADFIAIHIDGESFLKIQLKGRLTVDKKYVNKNIYIVFNQNNQWFLYPHDTIVGELKKMKKLDSDSWNKYGGYSWPSIPVYLSKYMKKYEIS